MNTIEQIVNGNIKYVIVEKGQTTTMKANNIELTYIKVPNPKYIRLPYTLLPLNKQQSILDKGWELSEASMTNEYGTTVYRNKHQLVSVKSKIYVVIHSLKVYLPGDVILSDLVLYEVKDSSIDAVLNVLELPELPGKTLTEDESIAIPYTNDLTHALKQIKGLYIKEVSFRNLNIRCTHNTVHLRVGKVVHMYTGRTERMNAYLTQNIGPRYSEHLGIESLETSEIPMGVEVFLDDSRLGMEMDRLSIYGFRKVTEVPEETTVIEPVAKRQELRVADLLQVLCGQGGAMGPLLGALTRSILSCDYHIAGHYGKYLLYYTDLMLSIRATKKPFFLRAHSGELNLLGKNVFNDIKTLVGKGTFHNIKVSNNYLRFVVNIDGNYLEMEVTPRPK